MNELYDDIGVGYTVRRCTDLNVAKQPSSEVISQRKMDSHPVEKAFAESLPFEDGSFSHAMTVLSMHHWENRGLAFSEINKVATDRFVAVTWDPKSEPFWLTRDYSPEIYEMDKCSFPVL